MQLSEYKNKLNKPLKQMTDTFLVEGDKVLLGYKKRGFGKNYFVGIGGKIIDGESIQQAAIRECYEETSILLPKLTGIRTIDFYFPHKQDESWNINVHIFIARMWKGKPKETSEVRPKWFLKERIPYSIMWDDARYWLPYVLEGKSVNGEFLFNEDLKVVDYTLII